MLVRVLTAPRRREVVPTVRVVPVLSEVPMAALVATDRLARRVVTPPTSREAPAVRAELTLSVLLTVAAPFAVKTLLIVVAPVAVRSVTLVFPVTSRAPPTLTSPMVRTSPVRSVVPPTASVLRFVAPATVSPFPRVARLETFKMELRFVGPVTARALLRNVEPATVSVLFAIREWFSVVRPATVSVLFRVVAPSACSVLRRRVAPMTSRVDPSVAGPSI